MLPHFFLLFSTYFSHKRKVSAKLNGNFLVVFKDIHAIRSNSNCLKILLRINIIAQQQYVNDYANML